MQKFFLCKQWISHCRHAYCLQKSLSDQYYIHNATYKSTAFETRPVYGKLASESDFTENFPHYLGSLHLD